MNRSILALWAASLVIALGVGAWIGRSTSVTILQGAALSGPNGISVEADGWTYQVPTDVSWIDVQGSWHENGRPECLPPDGLLEPVTFAAVQVSIEGSRWRPVLWVSCL